MTKEKKKIQKWSSLKWCVAGCFSEVPAAAPGAWCKVPAECSAEWRVWWCDMIQLIWTLFNAAPFRHRLRSWQPSQPPPTPHPPLPPTSSAHKHCLFWQGLAPIKPSAQRNSKATFLQNHNIMHFFCVFSLLFFFFPPRSGRFPHLENLGCEKQETLGFN